MKKQLDSLRIERFRQIKELSIPEVGHVNLVVGGNNSGKSTLLDALRFYAANAAPRLVRNLLIERGEAEEVALGNDLKSIVPPRALSSLFHGRKYPERDGEAIYVGNIEETHFVRLEHVLQTVQESQTTDELGSRSVMRQYKVVPKSGIARANQAADAVSVKSSQVGDSVRSVADFLDPDNILRNALLEYDLAMQARCVHVSPEFPLRLRHELVGMWSAIVLTPGEQIALDALRVIDDRVQDLAFKQAGSVGHGPYNGHMSSPVVKLAGTDSPVPLASMGDGMGRVLHLVLSALFAGDGLLLVDEFENGLHYTVQAKVWEMLFGFAQKQNLQIFATTHSNDCVRAFCEVALKNTDVDGKLLKLERMPEDGQTVVSVLGEQSLSNLLDAGLEVRG